MAAPDIGAGTEPYARRWWALSVLCLSLLIVFIGNSSLNVAIPTLSRELHATESQLQWVVAIYSLVFAGLLFSTGAIGDRFGRKGALQLGLLLFLFGAGLASLSTAMWQLIACGAVASGLLLGHFWYGSVFLINVPIIVLALVSGHFLVPKSRDPEQASFD